MSVSARLAETTSAFPPEGVEDKKSMTDKIDNHHPVGKVAYNQVKSFSWDAGSYNSGFVTVYVPLEGTILPNPKDLAGFIACIYKDIVVGAQLLENANTTWLRREAPMPLLCCRAFCTPKRLCSKVRLFLLISILRCRNCEGQCLMCI